MWLIQVPTFLINLSQEMIAFSWLCWYSKIIKLEQV
jgi:hypothetical protein